MAHPELLALSLLRGLIEVALLSLLGQGLLAVLAGTRRATNPIYMLFQVVTRPAIKAVRWLAPKIVLDRHIPIATFFLLFGLWIFLAYLKRIICVANEWNCLA